MASPTTQTRKIRKQKQANKGKVRKAQLRNQGTTRSAAELFGDAKD